MGYYNYNKNSGMGTIGYCIALLVLLFVISGISKSCSRSYSNMIYISDGYCYHEDTYIIYIESLTGRYDNDTTYAPYYDENGNMAKYNPATGEWIPVAVINEEEY